MYLLHSDSVCSYMFVSLSSFECSILFPSVSYCQPCIDGELLKEADIVYSSLMLSSSRFRFFDFFSFARIVRMVVVCKADLL